MTPPLLYRQPRVLQPALHRGLAFPTSGLYGFSAQANAVPLLAAEMTAIGRRLPIVFTGDAQPQAVLGLRAQQNLCIDEAGRWIAGPHVPAYLRRYPFIFLEDTTRHELTLCIDEAAAVPAGPNAPALFDDAGQPTAITRSALAFCRDYQAHHLLTLEFGQALATAGLLVDKHADVALHDGQRLSLNGFQVIDEARFNQLPAETLAAWRDKGWLALVYAHLQSLDNWSTLIDRLRDVGAVESGLPAGVTSH
jgi:hypothetical protein